jgi:hypothetical protein
VQDALLARAEHPLYDRLVRWLRSAAKASCNGQIMREEELPDGAYMVNEEWPSKAAYMEFYSHRVTLEAMLYTEESSPRDPR